MNKIYYFLALITLLFACKGEIKETKEIKLNKNNLFGEVKSIRESYYRAEGADADFKLQRVYTTEFNKEANKTSYIQYKLDGSVSSKQLYTYDEKNNLIEDNSYTSYGELFIKTTYKYDNKGNIIEEILFEDNYPPLKQLYKYDDRGNLIEKEQYNPDGFCWNKILYEYNDRGNMVEENHFSSEDLHVEKKLYKYNDNGDIIEVESHYSLDSSFNYKVLSIYDDKSNLIEYSYIKDDNSQPSKEIYKYKFDKKGNWITSTTFKDGIPQNKTEREIEYFD